MLLGVPTRLGAPLLVLLAMLPAGLELLGMSPPKKRGDLLSSS